MSGRTTVALLITVVLLAHTIASSQDRAGGPCAGVESSIRSAAEALDRGEWAEAERRLQPLSASHADCGGAVLGLARLRAAQGEPEEAERLFARAIALAPNDALAHALFAQYWLSRGQPARAEDLTARALSLNPDCPEALVVKGRLLSMRGQIHEAFQALEKAARLNPANAEAQFRLAIWFFGLRLSAEAAPRFEKVATLRPVDALALDYLALSREALGEAEGAETAYRSALKVNEGAFFDSFLDYNYGRFLLKQMRLEESRSHLDRAVALMPDHRGVHYERAKLKMALSDFQAAREDGERALSLRNPGNLVLDVQVYYLLSNVYARLGERELARKYAELSRTTAFPK
jgi:tetratricopeptide (TPR) repeat protein